MSKIDTALQWMLNMAADDSHGYDQQYRWGERGDYDCSSAVITACEQAGIPLKTAGATYTGNMKAAAIKLGCFLDVKNSVNISTGEGLLPGDILLNESHHVAMYCGNGKLVHASINENGRATGGKPGDQTGREFFVRSYYNYPWNCVLRYTAGSSDVKVTDYNAVGIVHVGDYLNVRLSAGLDGTVIGGFVNGDTVYIDGKCENGWYRTKIWDGTTGYVSGDYVEITQELPKVEAYTEPNDIVWELGHRGIVNDTDGLLAEILASPNGRLYWLAHNICQYLRERD